MKYYTITSDDLMDCKVDLEKAIGRLEALESVGVATDDGIRLALARWEMYRVLARLESVVIRTTMEG